MTILMAFLNKIISNFFYDFNIIEIFYIGIIYISIYVNKIKEMTKEMQIITSILNVVV